MESRLVFFASAMTLGWLAISCSANAQYFIDIFSSNVQMHEANGIDNKSSQQGVNTWVNAFVPVVRPGGNTLILRATAEQLNLSNDQGFLRLRSLTMPLGVQWKTQHPKWKHTTLLIPKIAGQGNLAFHERAQFGVYWLSQYTFSDSIRLKMGLYVNKEFFGIMYVPLLGLDWKINHRWSLYGTLPNSLRCSFVIKPNAWHTGIGFKSMVRSFRSDRADKYVRYNEIQLKYFVECVILKNWVVYGELGYFLGKPPLLYQNDADKGQYVDNELLHLMKPFPMINVGMALRIFQ